MKTRIGRLAALTLGCACALLALELLVRGAAGLSLFLQDRANRTALSRGGGIRILCVGESTTAGVGGAPEAAYPFQLGEVLRARGVPAAVVNGGRGDTDSTFIVSELEKNLDRYRPQVVVAMMGINDRMDMDAADSVARERGSRPLLRSWRLVPLLREALARRRQEAALSAEPYLAVESLSEELFRLQEARWFTGIYAARREGRLADAEAATRAALAAYPGVIALRLGLSEVLRERGRAREAEEVLRIEAQAPDSDAVRLRPGEPSDGKALLAGVSPSLFADPEPDRTLIRREYLRKQLENLRLARFELLRSYLRRGETRAAEELRDRMRKISPSYLLAPPGPFPSPPSRAFPGTAPGVSPQDLPALFPGTARNFSRLRSVLERRGIRLVCVQYPRRDVRLMKAFLGDAPGVVFVDNKTLYDAPLRAGRYRDWFVDACYGDFGHGTRKGNRLLAESVADALAREVLPGLRPR